MAQLKRFGGWKSSTAAERYIDVSDAGKTHAAVALSQSSLRSFPSDGVLVVGGSGRGENRKLEVTTDFTTTSNTVDDTAVGFFPMNQQNVCLIQLLCLGPIMFSTHARYT